MNFRTDLAIESKEMIDEENSGEGKEISGVSVEEHQIDEGVNVVRIQIMDDNGRKAMGKPIGNYITIEVKDLVDGSEERKQVASKALEEELSRLINFHENIKVLLIGLGNEKVTPDSLGPNTVSKIKATRHMFLFTDNMDPNFSCVSALIPGVMGRREWKQPNLSKGRYPLQN